MLLKPVCVPCQRFFRCEKNGYWLTEGMPNGRHSYTLPTPIGKEAAEFWQPYKLWVGDKWRCEGCGAEIVVGVAGGPVSEHYKPEFNELNRRSQLQVNDC
jgi:hypothetical protein